MSKEAKADKAPGIGAVAVAAITEGKTNEETLEIVKKAFPDGKTGMASINWYRNKLRADGATLKGSKKAIPTSREQKKAASDLAEKAKKAAAKDKKAADPLA